MYNYSPISKIYIKNFRNIGEVELDFSQSPIITLLGENEAGKTSVIKAFSTCALHANPRDQKDFIRDTTKMFGVAIDLADGTRILRMKEATGVNSYQVIKPDGTKWATNKITDGLPSEVQSLMGLIEEPETKEFLHVRTYEDKLLFVVTPASANYKVMYNALKVEQLTKAIKTGSSEVNGLKNKLNTNEASIATLNNQIRDVQIIDTEPLINVRNSLQNKLSLLDKLERLKNLNDKLTDCERQLGALGLLDRFNLKPISEVTASKLSTINRLLNNKSNLVNYSNVLSEVNNIQEIDVSIVNKLYNVINKNNILRSKIEDAGALSHVSEISEVSEVLVLQLNKTKTMLDKFNTLKNNSNNIDVSMCNEVDAVNISAITKLQKMYNSVNVIETKKQELEQINSYIEQVQNYLKQCGVAVEACPRCGEAVIFDVDKM